MLIEMKLSPKVAFFLYQFNELLLQSLGLTGTEGRDGISNGDTRQERSKRRQCPKTFSIAL